MCVKKKKKSEKQHISEKIITAFFFLRQPDYKNGVHVEAMSYQPDDC